VGVYRLKTGGDGSSDPDTDGGVNWELIPTQAKVDAKADKATTYTETEVDNLLNAKAAISGQAFSGNISAPNLSGTNTGDTALFTGANQSLSTSGYQKFPGGLIVQWMNGSTDAAGSGQPTQNLVFPISFPNAVFQVMVSTNTSASSPIDVWYQTYSPTYTGVSVQRQLSGTSDDVASTPIIFAIGY
jgi:hypothetical protein